MKVKELIKEFKLQTLEDYKNETKTLFCWIDFEKEKLTDAEASRNFYQINNFYIKDSKVTLLAIVSKYENNYQFSNIGELLYQIKDLDDFDIDISLEKFSPRNNIDISSFKILDLSCCLYGLKKYEVGSKQTKFTPKSSSADWYDQGYYNSGYNSTYYKKGKSLEECLKIEIGIKTEQEDKKKEPLNSFPF